MEYYDYFSQKFWQFLWGLWQTTGLEISTSIVLFLLYWLILSVLVTYILWRKRPKTPHFWRKHLLLNSIICLPLSLFINLGYIVMRFIMPARNQAAYYGQLTLHPLEQTFVTLFNVIYSYEWLFLVSVVAAVNVLLLAIWRKKIFKQSTLSWMQTGFYVFQKSCPMKNQISPI